MYLTNTELKTAVESYQLDFREEEDITTAIDIAIEEVKGYLNRYDTNAIFSAEGSERNVLILELTKVIALWYLMQKTNVDITFDTLKERYESATNVLKEIAKGTRHVTLPAKVDDKKNNSLFRWGGNKRFFDPDTY